MSISSSTDRAPALVLVNPITIQINSYQHNVLIRICISILSLVTSTLFSGSNLDYSVFRAKKLSVLFEKTEKELDSKLFKVLSSFKKTMKEMNGWTFNSPSAKRILRSLDQKIQINEKISRGKQVRFADECSLPLKDVLMIEASGRCLKKPKLNNNLNPSEQPRIHPSEEPRTHFPRHFFADPEKNEEAINLFVKPLHKTIMLLLRSSEKDSSNTFKNEFDSNDLKTSFYYQSLLEKIQKKEFSCSFVENKLKQLLEGLKILEKLDETSSARVIEKEKNNQSRGKKFEILLAEIHTNPLIRQLLGSNLPKWIRDKGIDICNLEAMRAFDYLYIADQDLRDQLLLVGVLLKKASDRNSTFNPVIADLVARCDELMLPLNETSRKIENLFIKVLEEKSPVSRLLDVWYLRQDPFNDVNALMELATVDYKTLSTKETEERLCSLRDLLLKAKERHDLEKKTILISRSSEYFEWLVESVSILRMIEEYNQF